MRIVLNSDVLYGNYTRGGVPKAVTQLADACADQGHVLVIPETTLLEVDRKQRDVVRSQRKALEVALTTLDERGVEHAVVDTTLSIPDVNVRDEFDALPCRVEILSPLLEDFQDAHERACLHSDPHPPDVKTDEMRDLIIWSMSLRLARAEAALLVSRDTVHTHSRGDVEAQGAGLARVESLDDALAYLDVKSVAGEQLESMLAPSYEDLATDGLPLGTSPTLVSVTNVEFLQGTAALASASASIKIRGDEGKIITARLKINLVDPEQAVLGLTDVRIDGKSSSDVSVTPKFEPQEEDESERLSALRAILED